jgi:hypothetical protein
MTAHAQNHSTQATQFAPSATGSARPRWLLPALVGVVVVGALVVFGVLSPSAALYGGLIGGMLLMHAGGHGGHGGGSGQGGQGGHGGGASGRTSDPVDLSRRSLGSQSSPSTSGDGLDGRAPTNPNGSETNDHDQRS